MCGYRAQNLLVLKSPQLSDDTWTSRLKAKGQRYYLSQNIGTAVAGSAGPAPQPV